MFSKNQIYSSSLREYIKLIYNVLLFPENTFQNLNLNYYQLTSYLVLSAWLYAVLANILKIFSVFIFLLLSPVSVLPHSASIALILYLIFGKLHNVKTSFKECFKISSYILIAFLPLMSLSCIPLNDTPLVITAKALPFVYFIFILYKATMVKFKKAGYKKIIMGNVLANLMIFFISTIIFSINMSILLFICEHILHFNYVWSFQYT